MLTDKFGSHNVRRGWTSIQNTWASATFLNKAEKDGKGKQGVGVANSLLKQYSNGGNGGGEDIGDDGLFEFLSGLQNGVIPSHLLFRFFVVLLISNVVFLFFALSFALPGGIRIDLLGLREEQRCSEKLFDDKVVRELIPSINRIDLRNISFAFFDTSGC